VAAILNSTRAATALDFSEPQWYLRRVEKPHYVDHALDAGGGLWSICSFGDWRFDYRFIEQDSEIVVSELRIAPAPRGGTEEQWHSRTRERPKRRKGSSYEEPDVPADGLTARTVRNGLSFMLALDGARFRGQFDLRQSGVPRREGSFFTDEALNAPQRVGRRGRPDRHYAALAKAYVDAVESGAAAPVDAVARRVGKNWSHDRVRDALHRARQRGLLTKPPRGRAGGQLTDKALALLAEKPKEQS
jgi:hypothetical protein